jgi:uncharacterized protein YjbI with pentapeptide repeats
MFRRITAGIRQNRIIIILSPIIVVILFFTLWAAREARKPIFDVIEILIIPVVLGIGAWLFQMAEKRSDRNNTMDRQRQDTLQTYFDRMSDLLLRRKLREAENDSEVVTIARARTLSALRSLDSSRIIQLMQFICELNLNKKVILNINLPPLNLQKLNLNGSYLPGTNLMNGDLEGASLLEANLQGADLSEAKLQEAILRETNLTDTKIAKANFGNAIVTEEQLSSASDWSD